MKNLFIDNATFCELGVSGTGLAWTDADHLELNCYAGDTLGAGGDLVVNNNPRISNNWTSDVEEIVR